VNPDGRDAESSALPSCIHVGNMHDTPPTVLI